MTYDSFLNIDETLRGQGVDPNDIHEEDRQWLASEIGESNEDSEAFEYPGESSGSGSDSGEPSASDYGRA